MRKSQATHAGRAEPMTWACAVAALAMIAGCSDDTAVSPGAGAGQASRGRELIVRYGCGSCHSIPGVSGANGSVGPPLRGIATRSYVGGALANTPQNMARWIRHPREYDLRTAMPDLGLSEAEARDITAYLYRLK